jgi:hypothetical protein
VKAIMHITVLGMKIPQSSTFFVQVVEAARDCLSKSKDGLLSSGYFMDLSENLQRLLYEV